MAAKASASSGERVCAIGLDYEHTLNRTHTHTHIPPNSTEDIAINPTKMFLF